MDFRQQLLFLTILITLFILHDLVQGYVAEKEGDNTARILGRLTANPLPHLDWFSSVFLPLTLLVLSSPIVLGWPKPMPFNPLNFKDKQKGLRRLGFAGLLIYFSLLVLGAIMIRIFFIFDAPEVLYSSVATVMQISASLLVLQLIPLPFLDMFYVLSGLELGSGLKKYLFWAERNSFWLSFVLLLILIQTPFFEIAVRFLTEIFI